jgi:LysM domain
VDRRTGLLAQSYKICPICDTPNHRNATLCSTCGTTLKAVTLVSSGEDDSHSPGYESVYGETDLLEGNLRWRGGSYILGGLLTIGLFACIGVAFVSGIQMLNAVLPATSTPPVTSVKPTETDALSNLPIVTNTERPTLSLATVTSGPPTLTRTATVTITPTQGPCVQEVQTGDSLIAIIARCGHRDYADLLQIVLDLNNLRDPNALQVGQSIEIPWPTPTFDPNLAPVATVITQTGSSDGTGDITVASAGVARDAAGLRIPATPTLQPGITWHRVVKDENIIIIAVQYGASLRILSELNPEVTFSQCDFGLGSGGPNCVVLLSEGQLIRVPAPTPTPTIQPTPSGSETPTPTVTPTFNIPSIISPSDRTFFGANEIVTLRWVGTGTLGKNEVYWVQVEDMTSGIQYHATTEELSFILPMDWQSDLNERHDYQWTVSVVNTNNPETPIATTEPRQFTWQGRESGS